MLRLYRGLYIGKYPPPCGGMLANVIWGKNMKRGREKGENVKKWKKKKRVRKKGERKRENGK